MKMLGQDVHTQEEFNTFYNAEFTPIVNNLAKQHALNTEQEKINKQNKMLAIAGLICGVCSLASVLLLHVV